MPLFVVGDGIVFLASRGAWTRLGEVLTFQQSSLWYWEVEFYPPQGPDDLLPRVVNGVLWTIRQEVTCYAFVAVMLVVGLLGRPAAIVAAALALAGHMALTMWPDLWSFEYPSGLMFVAPSFAVGVVLHGFAAEHRVRGWLAGVLAVLTITLAVGWSGWKAHATSRSPR